MSGRYVVVAAVFALGEACTEPTAEVISVLGELLTAWVTSQAVLPYASIILDFTSNAAVCINHPALD